MFGQRRPGLDEFVDAVRRAQATTRIALSAGIEAKLLTLDGDLDMPSRRDGVDCVFVADHQFPSHNGPVSPKEVRQRLRAGELQADAVVDDLLTATTAAVRRHHGVVIAHLFSIVPKVGLDPASIPLWKLEPLIEASRIHGACVEVDERWRCPSLPVLQAFVRGGVRVLASSDSHRPDHIGRYRYVAEVFARLPPC